MTVLIVLGGLLGLIFVYLLVIIFFPIPHYPLQPLDRRAEPPGEAPVGRESVEYSVDGEVIRSWLYLPRSTQTPVPCVVLCNGFGGTKDIVLERYATAFTDAGLAALALEYRHYGESDGEPRQVFSICKQEQDIRASVDYVRQRPEVDGSAVFVWGTSSAGQYGLVIAGDDSGIAGVITQCASLDHKKDSKYAFEQSGIWPYMKLFVHGQRDKGRSRFGLSPQIAPMVGLPGTTAMLTSAGVHDGYGGLVHPASTFRNEICARVALAPHGSDPIEKAKTVQCPVLLCVCEDDEVAAPGSHEQVAEILGDKAAVMTYPVGHFDVYHGEWFTRIVADQVDFLLASVNDVREAAG